MADEGVPRDYSGPQTLVEAAQAWAELQLEHGLVQSIKLVKKLVPVYTMALSNWDQQFLSRIVLSAQSFKIVVKFFFQVIPTDLEKARNNMVYTLAPLEAMVQRIMAKLYCLMFEMVQLGPGTTLKAINKFLQHLNKNCNMKIFSGFGLMTSLVSENLTLPRMIKDHLI